MGTAQKLNLITALTALATVLFGYFTYSSSRWIDRVEGQIRALQETDAVTSPRVATLEYGFREVISRLDRMEGKQDRIEGKIDRLSGRDGH